MMLFLDEQGLLVSAAATAELVFYSCTVDLFTFCKASNEVLC